MSLFIHPILQGIRWIVFDAVGTLVYPEPSVSTVYHSAAVRHGSKLSREAIRTRFLTAFDAMENADCDPVSAAGLQPVGEAGLLSNEEREELRWRKIVAEVLSDLPEARRERCFRELFEHFASATAWRCFDDVSETLAVLQSAGFQLGIASNFDHRLHALCDGLPELAPLRLRIISSEIGHRKPSIHFFHTLRQMIGVPADAILMVGDDERNDVKGARAAGIRAIQVNRGETAHAGELRSLRELINAPPSHENQPEA